MRDFLPKWLDGLLRKHPTVAICLVILSALAAVVVLLSSGHALVAYEGF